MTEAPEAIPAANAPPRRRRPGLGAVLERELIRSSRRWQTWGLRFGFATVLLVLVALYWGEEVSGLLEADRNLLAQRGRVIFGLYVWTQFLVLTALTPILVAQSVIEEREGRTLDILSITRLSPGRILLGKLLARLVGLELLVLGGMPVLAVCTSLGGVELSQLVSVWLNMTALILSLGSVAAFCALFARGSFSVAFVTWMWMSVAYTFGAIPNASIVQTEQSVAFTSPFFCLLLGEGWSVIGPLLTWLPVSAAVLALGAAGFRAAMAGADDPIDGFGTLSKDFEALRKMRTWLAVLLVVVLAATPLVILQKVVEDFFWPIKGVSWVWNITWLWVGTGIYLLIARALFIRLGRRPSRRHEQSWRQVAREWEQMTPAKKEGEGEAGAWSEVVPSTGRTMAGRPTADELKVRKARFSVVRQVWRNPVAWRETVTRAHGGLSQAILRSYVLLFLVGGGFVMLGVFIAHPFFPIATGIAAFFMAAMVVITTASASMAGELRSRSLELLCATRLGPVRILWGKLLSTGLLMAPAYATGVLMFGLGLGLVVEDWVPLSSGQRVEALGVLLRWITVSGWFAVALFTVANGCHWIGLRASTASRVWVSTVTWATVLVVGPPLMFALFEGNEIAEVVIGVLNPLMSENTWEADELPWHIGVSILAWGSAAVVMFAVNVRLLPRRASR